ncbi:MAG TPA: hypothetical protein VHQ90_15215 [Thermoanaerobaculia bacterium]|nr:hypothetical protein [Thermoanaerobaculia bacterium]
MMGTHFSDDALAFISLIRRLHQGYVDVMVQLIIADVFAAIDALTPLLTGDQDKPIEYHQITLPHLLQWGAIRRRAGLPRPYTLVTKVYVLLVFYLRLELVQFFEGHGGGIAGRAKIIFLRVLRGLFSAASLDRA